MDDLFDQPGVVNELGSAAVRELHELGFVILPSPFLGSEMTSIGNAYDAIVASASEDDRHEGRTTTRVNDSVNRGLSSARFMSSHLCCKLVAASSAHRTDRWSDSF